jgi:hypothetical protein
MSSRLKLVLGLAAIAVVALGWSAFAADDRSRGGNGDEQGDRWAIPVPPPPKGEGDRTFRFQGPAPEEGRNGEMLPLPPPGGPHGGPPGGPLGPEDGELTNGELNVQRDGEAVTVQIDRGEIAAVDSD